MPGFRLEPEEPLPFLPDDGGQPPVDLDLRALTTELHFPSLVVSEPQALQPRSNR